MYISNITPEELDKLELGTFPGKIYVIDELGKAFDEAIRYLKHKTIIGFDTESRPCFSAGQPHYGVSLLQLSGSEKAYLFRVKAIGMHKKLCKLLADENIIKVGAAVNDDIRGLQRLSDFKPAGFVDLQKMVGDYGIRDKSVKKMTAIILGMRISKAQQLSNWEADTLSDAQQAYAATDAWVCREMYKKLMRSKKCPLVEETQKEEAVQAEKTVVTETETPKTESPKKKSSKKEDSKKVTPKKKASSKKKPAVRQADKKKTVKKKEA